MKLVITHNNETTVIALHNYCAHTERQCVELVTEDSLRIYNNDELLVLDSRLFSLSTPFEYYIVIERVENLNVQNNRISNFRRSRDWLLYGDGCFLLDNVRLRIEDNDRMITIEIPADATVSLETSNSVEELQFKEYAVMHKERVTNFE